MPASISLCGARDPKRSGATPVATLPKRSGATPVAMPPKRSGAAARDAPQFPETMAATGTIRTVSQLRVKANEIMADA